MMSILSLSLGFMCLLMSIGIELSPSSAVCLRVHVSYSIVLSFRSTFLELVAVDLLCDARAE
jgi:hypothetical protein